jgi:hypothetical protein
MVRFDLILGWAAGENITTGQVGIFPLAVCEELYDGTSSITRPKSTRTSRTYSLLPPASEWSKF